MFLSANQLLKITGWEVWATSIESNCVTFILKCLDQTADCPVCGSKDNGSLGIRLVAKMSNKQNPCCAMILPDG